jgi:hypothetical protein
MKPAAWNHGPRGFRRHASLPELLRRPTRP